MRVSSSAVREALAAGDMALAAAPARPALQHQRPRGARPQARPRASGFPHAEPALCAPAAGRHGHLRRARARPRRRSRCAGVANLGVRPTVDDQRPRAAGDALPRLAGAARRRGRLRSLVRVELLHKLHDELRYDVAGRAARRHRRRCDAGAPMVRRARVSARLRCWGCSLGDGCAGLSCGCSVFAGSAGTACGSSAGGGVVLPVRRKPRCPVPRRPMSKRSAHAGRGGSTPSVECASCCCAWPR